MGIVLSPQSALLASSGGGGGGGNTAVFSQTTKAKISDAWSASDPTVKETIGSIDIHGYFPLQSSSDNVSGPNCVLVTSASTVSVGDTRTAIIPITPKVGTTLGETMLIDFSYRGGGSTTFTLKLSVGKISNTGIQSEMGNVTVDLAALTNTIETVSLKIPKTNTITIGAGDKIYFESEVTAIVGGSGNDSVWQNAQDTSYFLFSFN